MARDIINPIASVVAAARKGLQQTTGATAKAERDRNRPRRHVILADTSASMAEPAGGRRKIDVLQDAMAAAPSTSAVVAFGAVVMPITPRCHLPQPSGGTPLHLALDYCASLDATDVLVISDGHPDNAAAALAAADRMRARIDVVYCGPENDHVGMEFMRRLARGGGAAHHHSMAQPQQLISAVRGLLLIEGPRR